VRRAMGRIADDREKALQVTSMIDTERKGRWQLDVVRLHDGEAWRQLEG
jgi:hypothetical protein